MSGQHFFRISFLRENRSSLLADNEAAAFRAPDVVGLKASTFDVVLRPRRDEMVMRKLFILLLLSAIGISLLAYSQRKRIQRKDPSTSGTVSSVLPVDQAKLMEAVIRAFRENKPAAPDKFSRFSLTQPGEEAFPPEYELESYKDDRSLARYRSIDLAKRQRDFYLYDFSDLENHGSYWVSEYYQGNDPLPFRCNFLIHHEPEGPAATRVEIFELAPRVWAGKRFAFDRHGPHYMVDIRNVEPTTSDRVEVLDLIKKATRQ